MDGLTTPSLDRRPDQGDPAYPHDQTQEDQRRDVGGDPAAAAANQAAMSKRV